MMPSNEGLPGSVKGKEPVGKCRRQETGFDPLEEDIGEKQISQDGCGQAPSPQGLSPLPHVL